MQNSSMHEKPARIARFHADLALRAGGTVLLPEEAAHHAVHVLRLRPGDEVTLFHGRGGVFAGRIAAIDRLRVSVDVLAHRPLERESPLAVTLVQGVSSSEKMDFTVQKAVELGATAVQPVIAARSLGRLAGERAEVKRAHWQRVAVSACEQCGRARVPELREPMDLDEWLASAAEGARIVLEPNAGQALAAHELQASAVAVVVGPEGGFSERELKCMQLAGVRALSLGPRILRTETAGPAAIAILQALYGDLGGR